MEQLDEERLALPRNIDQRRRKHMMDQDHLAELEQRHHAIEKEIADVLKHKSADDLEIVELKRQKLHLKDAIERLQHGITAGNK